LYESVDGKLVNINVLEGEPVPGANFGGFSTINNELPSFSNAISSDGSRIFWTDTQPGANLEHIYVFENGTHNVPVSAGPAEYWTATPDGRYAFYTEGGALWRFNTEPGVAEPREELTTSAAEVQGVIGTNQVGKNGVQGEEDGEYVYFVANEALASGASKQQCRGETEAEANGEEPKQENLGCNLYLLHGKTVTFVARLSVHDDNLASANGGPNNRGGDWQQGLGERTAEVTPDGKSLVFESVEYLTGYDARLPEHQPNTDPEVFVYAAEGNSLSCASCDPAGRAPSVAKEEAFQSKLPVSTMALTYQHRWISGDGQRVFFDTSQPLVSQDTGETQDVYEWERQARTAGANNSCTETEVSMLTGGCTFLLSGNGEFDSFLADADTTGENVFFEHVGPMGAVAATGDENVLYDARVGGGFPAAEVSAGCGAATCAPSTAPPAAATEPATVAFNGIGNFTPLPPPKPPAGKPSKAKKLSAAIKACKRYKKRQRRHACEKQARKAFGAKATTKSTTGTANRRGSGH
jgi:hypothetical protein